MKSYLTTPIYYVNASPHLGHAFTSVVADILQRQRRRLGIDTLLSTGCDEHGQKNARAAEAAGLAPQAYLDRRSAEFRSLFDRLDVGYDIFVRTSSAHHVRQVQRVVVTLRDAGLLHRKSYAGHYCAGCEQFKRSADLDAAGHCLEHPNILAPLVSEENYFLRIEPFRPAIVDRILSGTGFVHPPGFRQQLLGLLREPLDDLCISRPVERVPLGVRLPFDPRYVVYVWFDALINYLGNLGWPEPGYREWWSSAEHLIGKDILKTHGVYWPAMLMALGEDLPRRLLVHSHWVGEGGLKMSKSLGNVVDPHAVIDELGADALRYVFARHMRAEADSAISVGMIRQSYAADLCNKLGNLLSRLVKFARSSLGARVPARGALTPADDEIRAVVLSAASPFGSLLALEDIPVRTAAAIDAVEHLNRYITSEAPWLLARSPAGVARCETVTFVAMDGLRLILEALWPVIPGSVDRALTAFGPCGPSPGSILWRPTLDKLQRGAPLTDIGPLFPKTSPTSAM